MISEVGAPGLDFEPEFDPFLDDAVDGKRVASLTGVGFRSNYH